ncbi:MAG TPA: response regulator transcription factor [Phototrophicaceae bacterium]|nr:response regulator transcription factor [Phototrophicaceae bacterium]
MSRILVVDDEPQMVDIVTFTLETHGHSCRSVGSAEEAWRVLTEETFDAVVLDVMLPGADGVQLCRRIRAHLSVPVVLLTARSEVDARVEGLEAGADDYVTKPFSPRELALRVEGILRRTARATEGRDVVANGPLTIDVRAREAVLGARRLSLPDAELGVLTSLTRRAGRVVTWRELLNEVWGTGAPQGGRQMIKTTVYRLRAHLEKAGGDEARELVRTVRGVGYTMPELPPD